MAGSANLNVMIQAARKAARRLVRDFNEVENLQVSVKGVGDFVSNADRKAEETIRDTLMDARPNYGFLGEEGTEIEGKPSFRSWSRTSTLRHSAAAIRCRSSSTG